MSTAWMFAESLRLGQLEQNVADGIGAIIEGYYENYTDACEIEALALSTLEDIIEWCPFHLDLDEIVVKTETGINNDGGIRSESGERHMVKTVTCWTRYKEAEED